jgi:hypothetical protein
VEIEFHNPVDIPLLVEIVKTGCDNVLAVCYAQRYRIDNGNIVRYINKL